ncbi:MAG: phosphoglycerate dehydrogenase [Alphaproteobacteria bacterium]
MNKILVTPRSLTRDGSPQLELLERAGFGVVFSSPGRLPTEEELKRLLPECVGYLAGVERITDSVLSAAPNLQVISRYGVGTDNIDLEAARRRNIEIRHARGANARGVAELTLGLILACLRSIPLSSARLRAGQWERRLAKELVGETVGLVGCGSVGQIVASMATAIGATVVAFDPFPEAGFSPGPGFRFASLEEVLRTSLVVSLHCPPLENGRPMIDSPELATMRFGAILINTARSGLVDDEAVLAALEGGKLLAYATDVFDKEPPAPSKLLAHERVIATPHIGAYTEQSTARVTRLAVQNLLESLRAAP